MLLIIFLTIVYAGGKAEERKAEHDKNISGYEKEESSQNKAKLASEAKASEYEILIQGHKKVLEDAKSELNKKTKRVSEMKENTKAMIEKVTKEREALSEEQDIMSKTQQKLGTKASKVDGLKEENSMIWNDIVDLDAKYAQEEKKNAKLYDYETELQVLEKQYDVEQELLDEETKSLNETLEELLELHAELRKEDKDDSIKILEQINIRLEFFLPMVSANAALISQISQSQRTALNDIELSTNFPEVPDIPRLPNELTWFDQHFRQRDDIEGTDKQHRDMHLAFHDQYNGTFNTMRKVLEKANRLLEHEKDAQEVTQKARKTAMEKQRDTTCSAIQNIKKEIQKENAKQDLEDDEGTVELVDECEED